MQLLQHIEQLQLEVLDHRHSPLCVPGGGLLLQPRQVIRHALRRHATQQREQGGAVHEGGGTTEAVQLQLYGVGRGGGRGGGGGTGAVTLAAAVHTILLVLVAFAVCAVVAVLLLVPALQTAVALKVNGR